MIYVGNDQRWSKNDRKCDETKSPREKKAKCLKEHLENAQGKNRPKELPFSRWRKKYL